MRVTTVVVAAKEERSNAITSLMAIAFSRAAQSVEAVALEREVRVYADVRADRGAGR